jgi:hypothetical protein
MRLIKLIGREDGLSVADRYGRAARAPGGAISMCWERIPPRCDRAVVEAANAHKGRMRSGTSASVGEPGRREPFRFRVSTELRPTFVAERVR